MTTKLLRTSLRSMLAAGIALPFLSYLGGGMASLAQDSNHDHDHDFHGFAHGSIVLSGTVYVGNADTVTPGEVLPHGCLNTGPVTNPNPATVNVPLLQADQTPSTTTTAATVTCGYASDNGEFPNLNDSHNVWNNASTDGSFGVSSPIILWDLSKDGDLLGTLRSARAGEVFRGVALAPEDDYDHDRQTSIEQSVLYTGTDTIRRDR